MRILVGAVFLMAGCSRCSPSHATAKAVDASAPSDVAVATVDVTPAPTSSVPVERVMSPTIFSLAVRAPSGARGGTGEDIAEALPLMQRVGNGGLAVLSEYGRALATGPGALSVDVASDDLADVYWRPVQQLIRWLWTDGTTSFATHEELQRSGPSLRAYSVGPKGRASLPGEGYWDAISRAGSVLALERVTKEPPVDVAGATRQLVRAHVAVLSGKAAALVIPEELCPRSMSAGPDGTVLVVVNKCEDGTVGFLRYPPTKTTPTAAWVNDAAESAAIAVASENEIYVGHDDTLETWDGKLWTPSKPFGAAHIISLSAGTDGTLWAIVHEGKEAGYITRKKPGASTWEGMALPALPTTPLDDEPWQGPDWTTSYFSKVKASAAPKTPLTPVKIDAAGPEILLLGTSEDEALVFSDKPRTPVARIPSIDTQRAQLAKAAKRKTRPLATAAKNDRDCDPSFLVFPDGTTRETLGLGAPPDGGPYLHAAMGFVEGKTVLIVYTQARLNTDDENVYGDLADAAKRFAQLGPTRLCGAAVIEKDL